MKGHPRRHPFGNRWCMIVRMHYGLGLVVVSSARLSHNRVEMLISLQWQGDSSLRLFSLTVYAFLEDCFRVGFPAHPRSFNNFPTWLCCWVEWRNGKPALTLYRTRLPSFALTMYPSDSRSAMIPRTALSVIPISSANCRAVMEGCLAK